MKTPLIFAALALAATPARGSVWSDATSGNTGGVSDFSYAKLLERGDDAATVAAGAQASPAKTVKLIDAAIDLYEDAARVEPKSGEPYERIGKLIFSFYFEACDKNSNLNLSPLCPRDPNTDEIIRNPNIVNKLPWLHARAEQMIAAWDAFEQRAPLDPRIDREFLFERAILHTKLATPEHLAQAARDYETLLDRFDGRDDRATCGNLAETYMMLGRIDDAIDMYQRAIAVGGDSGAVYGLAVALDRDERTEAAHDLILEAGPVEYRQFVTEVEQFRWFFVPPEEKFYYLALAEEAFGQVDRALDDWQAFIDAGIYPAYQPRAKAHLAQLQMQSKLHPKILRPQQPFDPLDE